MIPTRIVLLLAGTSVALVGCPQVPRVIGPNEAACLEWVDFIAELSCLQPGPNEDPVAVDAFFDLFKSSCRDVLETDTCDFPTFTDCFTQNVRCEGGEVVGQSACDAILTGACTTPVDGFDPFPAEESNP